MEERYFLDELRPLPPQGIEFLIIVEAAFHICVTLQIPRGVDVDDAVLRFVHILHAPVDRPQILFELQMRGALLAQNSAEGVMLWSAGQIDGKCCEFSRPSKKLRQM